MRHRLPMCARCGCVSSIVCVHCLGVGGTALDEHWKGRLFSLGTQYTDICKLQTVKYCATCCEDILSILNALIINITETQNKCRTLVT